jgi:hypothetical protein
MSKKKMVLETNRSGNLVRTAEFQLLREAITLLHFHPDRPAI